MFIQIPKGFIPDQDTDQIHAVTEAAQGTSYYQMVDYQKRVAEVFRTNPDVEALMSTVGGTAASTLGGPNYGELVVHLKPRSQRKLLVNDIIEDLRPQLANFPGMRVYLQNPPDHPDRRPGHQEPVPVLHAVARQAGTVRRRRRSCKRARETAGRGGRDQRPGHPAPQVNVTIDRDKAAALHVNADADRKRVLRRLRPALGLHHLRGRSTNTRCCWN